jgi:DNA integrity scanning protein DisA with diadenylate cyclase activity
MMKKSNIVSFITQCILSIYLSLFHILDKLTGQISIPKVKMVKHFRKEGVAINSRLASITMDFFNRDGTINNCWI